jgi:hypothetical protein
MPGPIYTRLLPVLETWGWFGRLHLPGFPDEFSSPFKTDEVMADVQIEM